VKNPLVGLQRRAILASAVAAAGHGARVIDEGAPLTLWKNRTTVVGIALPKKTRYSSESPHKIVFIRVNVDTLATAIDD